MVVGIYRTLVGTGSLKRITFELAISHHLSEVDMKIRFPESPEDPVPGVALTVGSD